MEDHNGFHSLGPNVCIYFLILNHIQPRPASLCEPIPIAHMEWLLLGIINTKKIIPWKGPSIYSSMFSIYKAMQITKGTLDITNVSFIHPFNNVCQSILFNSSFTSKTNDHHFLLLGRTLCEWWHIWMLQSNPAEPQFHMPVFFFQTNNHFYMEILIWWTWKTHKHTPLWI